MHDPVEAIRRIRKIRKVRFGKLLLCAFLSVFCLAMTFALEYPVSVYAQDSGKTVRVGWYQSSFNTIDQFGRRSGYAYEYQLKIAAYTGWNYEYVNGSWSQLMEMLVNGEIDLMSDVSYTPEREELMLFSSLPMGAEEYYLFIDSNNQEISSEDYATLNGKKIGVNKGSIQEDFYLEWARHQGVQAELVEVTCSEEESLQMLKSGELDAYITVDAFTLPENLIPVCLIGSSDFYFAVNLERPDLLSELNIAMNRIMSENRYYNQQMFEKYITTTGSGAVLTPDESEWLSGHGPIRVGYQDNYLAFCAEDKTTGELTGALKDYLNYASECMINGPIEFEATAYPTAAAALDAMKQGEVDCAFPVNFSSYEGEMMDAVITPPLIRTDIYAVIRQTDQSFFAGKEHVIVAVNEGNPNYDSFLKDHYPDWTIAYYPNTLECLQAVADGVADCVLISSYRYNNIARICDQYHLMAMATGVGIDYSFAVNTGETELYSILAKVSDLIPDSTLNAALSYYTTEDAKISFTDFIMDHLPVVLAVIAAIVLVILALLLRSMRAERKAARLIAATETDDLTGLYNRSYFFQYANLMFQEHHETPMDAFVLNIEQFHSVNALNGREFGDQILKVLGSELQKIAQENEGIAGRFEADRFDIYCRNTEEYQAIFDRLQGKLDDLAPNANIRLRMGVMPWQENLEPVQQFDMARTACSMARGHYKEHLIIFNEKVREREIYEQRLVNDLRRALDSHEFEVYYQPKYDIQSDPPVLVSAEALVRWHHPEFGLVSPGDFIPLFEQNGQISELDKYVWTEAARQVAKWREQYKVTIPISVNLSRVDVFDPALEETLDKILQDNNLEYSALKLEVTESAYTENADQVIQVVEGLRKKGYEVEMDDFGTGYSSLNMLSAMPIDVLKMDRAFIRNIEEDEKNIQLVALILDIAKNLKVPVVAEGVETKSQMLLLRELGCALVQGYYFSPPLSSSDFEAMLLQKPPSDE